MNGKKPIHPDALRLLYVAHGDGTTDTIQTTLAGMNHVQIVPAQDESVMQALATCDVDAIIIDVEVDSTLNFCRHLRQKPALDHVPMIAMSVSQPTNRRIRALRAGADLYLHYDDRAETAIQHQIEQLVRAFQRIQAGNSPPTQTSQSDDTAIETLLHDLKNPLSIIYGSASLIEQQERLSPEHQREAIDGILEAVKETRKLIGDWLNLARMKDGEYLEFESMPFLNFLSSCVESYYSFAQSKNINLSFQMMSADQAIEFDHDRMVQVVSNLVTNAIKYTPDGGQVTVSGRIAEDQAVLQVVDTGIGIEADAIEKIFDRFYRTRRTSKSDIAGTGLGLAICKAIVEHHNGTISVESTVGSGTIFTVTLPHRQAN